MDLVAGTYTVEWYSVNSRETREAGKITVQIAWVTFSAPFEVAGPAVLYMNKKG